MHQDTWETAAKLDMEVPFGAGSFKKKDLTLIPQLKMLSISMK